MYENNDQLTANKVLILHVLDKLDMFVSELYLTEVILAPGLVNYFSMQQAIAQLVSMEMIDRILDSNGLPVYCVTNKGREIASSLSYMIAGGLGARYDRYIDENKEKISQKMNTNSDVFEDERGNYYVRCYVREGTNCIVDLKIPVGSRKAACAICEAWKLNSTKMYLELTELFYKYGDLN